MSKKQKRIIVFTISKPIVGGAQLWVANLAKLLNSKYEVHIITSGEGWLTKTCNTANIHLIPKLDCVSISALFNLKKCLSSISPDIVVSNSAFAGLYSRLLSPFYNFKSIYVSHGWSSLYKKGLGSSIYLYIERFLSYLTDYILCISKSDVDKAVNVLGINPSKVKLITNSVFPSNSSSSKLELEGGFNVLFVGRLESPKRPDIFTELLSRLPSVNGYLVGDGSLRASILSNLPENVAFLGEVSNFNDFDKFDLFVLASDSEGLPMSAIQSLSQAVPILISNVGGCSELISSDLPNGILCENTVQSFHENFLKIFGNYSYYKRNCEMLMGNYDIRNDLVKFDELFNK